MKNPLLPVLLIFLLIPAFAWAQIPEKEYYPDGTLKVDWYSEFGDEDITRKEFYPNGGIMNEAVYINGKLDGVYKEYGPSGAMLLEMKYINHLILY